MRGAGGSEDLMLSRCRFWPREGSGTCQLRLCWRKGGGSSHRGYGGRGGKDQYMREGCSVVALFLGQVTEEKDHDHSLSIPDILFGEEPPPSYIVFSFESRLNQRKTSLKKRGAKN